MTGRDAAGWSWARKTRVTLPVRSVTGTDVRQHNGSARYEVGTDLPTDQRPVAWRALKLM